MSYIYILKVKEFQVCAYLRFESVEENGIGLTKDDMPTTFGGNGVIIRHFVKISTNLESSKTLKSSRYIDTTNDIS